MDSAELPPTFFSIAARNLGLLLLRALAGVSMIVHHAWAMVLTGWEYYWHGSDWILVEAATAMQLPQPVVFATLVAITFFLGSIFLILGILGRITSGALLAAILLVLYGFLTRELPGAPELQQFWIEVCILYAMAYIVHFIMGSGAIALDLVFARFQRPKRHRSLEDVG
ncbi:MAG: DoxX family membrane protein [Verrucomicrobiota bacterium]